MTSGFKQPQECCEGPIRPSSSHNINTDGVNGSWFVLDIVHAWDIKCQFITEKYLKTKQMVSQAEIWIQDETARLYNIDDLNVLRSAQER